MGSGDCVPRSAAGDSALVRFLFWCLLLSPLIGIPNSGENSANRGELRPPLLELLTTERFAQVGWCFFGVGGEKSRNWTFILYPESAPIDWLPQLKLSGLPFAISPEHNLDVDKNGELLKPHRHCFVRFPTARGYTSVLSLTKSLNATIPQKVYSVKGLYEYFIHNGLEDKFHYDPADIITGNGFDLDEKSVNPLPDIFSLIKKERLFEFSLFMDFLVDSRPDLLDIMCNQRYYWIVNKYIESYRFNMKGDFK